MSENGDPFDTAGMAEALPTAPSLMEVPANKEDAAAKAREFGWMQPTAYDYSAFDTRSGAPPIVDDGAALAVDRDTAEGERVDGDIAADAVPYEGPAWLSQAAVYEWSDEFGEVGEPNEALEKQLYRDDFQMVAGQGINTYEGFQIKAEGPVLIRPIREFDDAGLHPVMRENIRLCGYDGPTPIQCYVMPAVQMGSDVVGIAQTGSGKTAAYMIPILSRLMGKAKKLAAPRHRGPAFNLETDRVRAEPLVLVVCPNRELACQIFDEARRLCYRSMLRPCVAYGGGPTRLQREELQRGCDILIATPGRLCDFMEKPDLLSLNRVRYTVIDEADELLDGDWEESMSKILRGGDTNEDADHLYLMFSATFNKAARKVAKEYMSEDYYRVRIGRAGSTHGNIKQEVIWCEDSLKAQCLYDRLFSLTPCRTLIFVNTKRQADLLDDYLYNLDLPSTSIHSDRTQREREDAIRAFRTGTSPIMVATGVSARGLDIKNIMHVVNYDLPKVAYGGIEDYVHRIGRTARIGNSGLATSFYNDANEDIASDLCKILVESKQEIPEFLQQYKPEDGEPLAFDDDSNAEDEAEAEGFGFATGADDSQAEEGFQVDEGSFSPAADDGGADW